MKKTLLLFGALALTAASAMADVHTFDFDGTDDMYGLTRQLTNNTAQLTYVQDWSFSEAGINFKAENTGTTGSGLALVKAAGDSYGLYFSTKVTPQITLSVPGGTISNVKLTMYSIAGMVTMELDMNGTATEGDAVTAKVYSFTWSDSQGSETVTITWPSSAWYARYVYSIEVAYTPDLGGKQECGLAFSDAEAEGVVGEAFTAPTLTNPHNLPLTWASSDETVATVDASGSVTLLGGGKTTITAATVGNDSYAAGNAKYTLSVIPRASTLAQMLAVAPAQYDRVKVNCPLTVTYASGNSAFVKDAQGNASLITDLRNSGSTSATAQIFSIGQVVPAGWIATNSSPYETIWEGLPETPTETVEVVYPEVETVTPADADRVVILKNVTFEGKTPVNDSKKWATTPNGTVDVQNIYNAPELPAGTYDMTCIVRYSKRGTTEYFYVNPIAYTEVVEPEPEFPAELDVTCDQTGVTIEQSIDEDTDAIMLNVTGVSLTDTAVLTFNLPEGWEGVVSVDMTAMMMSASRASSEWPTLDQFEAEYEGIDVNTGTTVSIPADGEHHMYSCMLYTTDHLVDVEHGIMLIANITKQQNGIDNIAVENGPARYYNMQGIEVAKPVNGAFIMVQNGKATKISK